MKCQNCGKELPVGTKFCSNCGAKIEQTDYVAQNNQIQQNNEGSTVGWGILSFFFPIVGLILFLSWKKTKPKAAKTSGIGALIGLIIGIVASIIISILISLFFVSTKNIINDNFSENDINNYIDEFSDMVEENIDKVNPSSQKYGLGDTFNFDDLQITIGNNYTFDVVKNQFSDYNNENAIKLPITVKNISNETKRLNIFYLNYFKPDGTETKSVGAYFDDSLEKAGELRKDASYNTYLYLLYDTDGKYVIEFKNIIDNKEIEFDVKK